MRAVVVMLNYYLKQAKLQETETMSKIIQFLNLAEGYK